MHTDILCTHAHPRKGETERDSTKMHSVKKEMEIKDVNEAIILVTKLLNYWTEKSGPGIIYTKA